MEALKFVYENWLLTIIFLSIITGGIGFTVHTTKGK